MNSVISSLSNFNLYSFLSIVFVCITLIIIVFLILKAVKGKNIKFMKGRGIQVSDDNETCGKCPLHKFVNISQKSFYLGRSVEAISSEVFQIQIKYFDETVVRILSKVKELFYLTISKTDNKYPDDFFLYGYDFWITNFENIASQMKIIFIQDLERNHFLEKTESEFLSYKEEKIEYIIDVITSLIPSKLLNFDQNLYNEFRQKFLVQFFVYVKEQLENVLDFVRDTLKKKNKEKEELENQRIEMIKLYTGQNDINFSQYL